MGYRDKDRSMQFLRGTNAAFRYYENILKNSQILIFDEATANIDEKRRGVFINCACVIKGRKIIIFFYAQSGRIARSRYYCGLEKLHIRQVSEK